MPHEKRTVTPSEVQRQRASFRKQLAPGVWMDADDCVHVSVPDVLRHFGWPDTPENREIITQATREVMSNANPDATIVEQETES
jgi:hypothetical protein